MQYMGWGSQSVKCLLCKLENLTLDPQHPHTKLSRAACTCRPSSGEDYTERALGPTGQPVQPNPQTLRDPVSKKVVASSVPEWRSHFEKQGHFDLLSKHVCMHKHTQNSCYKGCWRVLFKVE